MVCTATWEYYPRKSWLEAEAPAIVRKESFDTLENRVLKDFILRCSQAAAHYLNVEVGLRMQGASRARDVRRYKSICNTCITDPVFEQVSLPAPANSAQLCVAERPALSESLALVQATAQTRGCRRPSCGTGKLVPGLTSCACLLEQPWNRLRWGMGGGVRLSATVSPLSSSRHSPLRLRPEQSLGKSHRCPAPNLDLFS